MKDINNLESVSYKRSLLIGMLLGDAFSRKKTLKSGRLRVEWAIYHASKQADLVEWKRDEINRLFGFSCNIHSHIYHNYSKVGFSFSAGRRFRVIQKWFYSERIKVISEKIRFMDHPVGLAILLCDDGSVRKRKKQHNDGSTYYLKPSITIATHSFTQKEVERLLDHIEWLCGAKGYINLERRFKGGKRVEYQRINFNVQNSKIVWDYISPWLPTVPSMLEKFAYAIEHFTMKTGDT